MSKETPFQALQRRRRESAKLLGDFNRTGFTPEDQYRKLRNPSDLNVTQNQPTKQGLANAGKDLIAKQLEIEKNRNPYAEFGLSEETGRKTSNILNILFGK